MTTTAGNTKHPNVEVWEQVYETFKTGDTDRLAQLIAPDVVCVATQPHDE